MSPFEIDILLHYYTTATDYRNGNFEAPVLYPTLEQFVEMGLLERGTLADDVQFKRTDATAVFIQALCAVPAPVQRWVIPE